MLQDIAQVALAVGRRLYPDRCLDDLDIASGSLLSRKSPIERLGFISQILPPLSQAIEYIAASPLTAPMAQYHRVAPPGQARRVDAAPLLKAIQSGHATRWMHETRTELSADTPENRCVFAFLRALRRDAIAIGRMAEAANEGEIKQTARACASRLLGLTQRMNWKDLSILDPGVTPTHRMLVHPVYTRVAEWIRRYRQSFAFDWTAPLFALPARETWRLYEAWGLLQTLNALQALGFSPRRMETATSQVLFAIKQDRLLFQLAKGEESVITLTSPRGRHVKLFYNRPFISRQQSLSRTMYPDITLEAEDGLIWILDPKFKTYAASGAEADDIDQMHAYRDAIVAGSGSKPVQRAWCLYVGQADHAARPVISYGVAAQSVVGALCLRPGDAVGVERLRQLLTAWGIS